MARKQRHDRRSNERELEDFLGALALEGRSAHSVRAQAPARGSAPNRFRAKIRRPRHGSILLD